MTGAQSVAFLLGLALGLAGPWRSCSGLGIVVEVDTTYLSGFITGFVSAVLVILALAFSNWFDNMK